MSKETDSYLSPEWISDLFEGWFDPCPVSNGELREFDGLGSDWKDRTYVNPPYSNPLKWVEKAIEENKKGKTIAMLLRVDTSTKWFAKILEAKAVILWLNGRIKYRRIDTYNKPTPANFASMLVIFPKVILDAPHDSVDMHSSARAGVPCNSEITGETNTPQNSTLLKGMNSNGESRKGQEEK